MTVTLDVIADATHRWLLDQLGSGHAPTAAEIAARVQQTDPLLTDDRIDDVVGRVHALADGLGPLDALLADPAVTEVMVGGSDGQVWVERAGRVTPAGLLLGPRLTLQLLTRVVARVGRRVDRASPIVDARLPDGSRVSGIVPPVAVDGPLLNIRRFSVVPVPLEAFGPPEVVDALAEAVARRLTIVISGGTSTGKTTLLNALAGAIPADERIVTIEEAAELRLHRPHVVRLEAQRANAEGRGAVGVDELVRAALRLRPDRLIIGEVRGAEAFDLLQALNTGHEGSLTTVHANDPAGALRRLETLAARHAEGWSLSAANDHLRAGVQLVVQLARLSDGLRVITTVARLSASAPDAGHPLEPLWQRGA